MDENLREDMRKLVKFILNTCQTTMILVTHDQKEANYIKKRLKEEAGICLAQFGIKGTTGDELVRRVKIPKVTIYLFNKSKELLVFEVLMEQHFMEDDHMNNIHLDR